MKTVIFACAPNAGRSQMAASLFTKLADPKQVRAISAGTDPIGRVFFEVVVVMASAGVDLTHTKPQLLTLEMLKKADVLVKMECGKCPTYSGVEVIEWKVPDPMGKNLEDVRAIRDQIRQLVTELLREKGWKKP